MADAASRHERDVGMPDFVRRLDVSLRPDADMVVLRPFRPSVEPEDKNPLSPNRIERIVSHVLSLTDAQRRRVWEGVLRGFSDRHIDIQSFFLRTFREIAEPYADEVLLTIEEQLLIGAYFSHEYSFQAAALFNPSLVPHPDQAQAGEGELRVVLSLRCVGEGHISSICFRTGKVTADGDLILEEPHQHSMIAASRAYGEDEDVHIHCEKDRPLDAAVLFPVTPAQSNGLEDLRLVRFEGRDGTQRYYGTYTAYSGHAIRSEMLETTDFRSFRMAPLAGDAARNKGMALFPRRVNDRYAMIGRQDNENLWLLRSNDMWTWSGGEILLKPRFPWEFVQIGNCGSPIELDEGWLILTHGVGPVRNYSIGAFLVDKADPSKVLARMKEPLLRPVGEEREGYVPNVVYTCGGLVHAGRLILPYAIADSVTTAVSMKVDDLLGAME